jgi:hypothetical protein
MLGDQMENALGSANALTLLKIQAIQVYVTSKHAGERFANCTHSRFPWRSNEIELHYTQSSVSLIRI